MRSAIALSFLLRSCVGTAFDEELAIQYARLCGGTYCGNEDKDLVEAWNCGTKCSAEIKSVNMCTGTSTISVVAHWEDMCVVAFEGSQTPKSFIVDLEATPEQIPYDCPGMFGCVVHAGFHDEWLSHKQCVKSNLDKLGCGAGTGKGIRTTGHSLGASVNLLAMIALVKEGYEVVESYHFGTPRTGNTAFATLFNQMFKGKHYRVTHAYDPVVHMPPPVGFEHVEPEVFYPGANSAGFQECTVAGNYSECSAQNWDFPWDVLVHAMDHLHYMDVNLDNGVANGCKYGIRSNSTVLV
eukprot:TRINITY_DN62352_c0_g1_i1.p1 TRINITY_DN62352_c0_g1~~TRINITY_DN62352_c0_g1_i1.p1  ORF type:complete len:310 (-),score=34.57 TRINITY_DN62352_c0_g1_i1:110-997(-)